MSTSEAAATDKSDRTMQAMNVMIDDTNVSSRGIAIDRSLICWLWPALSGVSGSIVLNIHCPPLDKIMKSFALLTPLPTKRIVNLETGS